jgi:hypothetical protein
MNAKIFILLRYFKTALNIVYCNEYEMIDFE